MDTGNRKKALVVDDSAFMRKLISDFLSGHPEIEVIGTARNGKDAVEKVQTLKPDVVTMDIEMPLMNGLEALKEIMDEHPVPVVMLSSTTKIGAENTMLAMEYGAVDFVAKPGGAISLNLHEVKEEIVGKVIAAASVRHIDADTQDCNSALDEADRSRNRTTNAPTTKSIHHTSPIFVIKRHALRRIRFPKQEKHLL